MAMDGGKDDLLAMILAARRLHSSDMARWIPMAGPLPAERVKRDELLGVASRGMIEVRNYLEHLGLLE